MQRNTFILPHPGIQTLSPYIPGKSAQALHDELGISDIIKLASNENPYGCSPQVLTALSKLSALDLATYCTSQAHLLREVLAEKLHLSKDCLLLANGSDTLFSLLMTGFALHQNKHVLTHEYAFITFAIQAQTLGVPLYSAAIGANWQVNIDALLNACSAQTAMVYLANPNNPTGGFIPHAAIERLLQHIPETTILVLDEAYQEYLPHQHDLIANICAYPNLVITRTFSKAYGLAGLRLGYAIGNPQLIAWLLRIQLPFMVNVATLTAGIAALHDDEFVASSVRHNQLGLEQMLHGLHALQVTCLPAYGNFVTINCHADATPVYLALQKKGIIVRPLHPYGLGDYLRVTIGTPAQIKRFLQVLPECLPLAIRNDHA